MKMGKSLRCFTLLSSLTIIGCDSDIAVHDDVYEERHIHHPRYVEEERVYREAPPPRPLPPDDVRVSVDSRSDDRPPVREDAPPPGDEQVSANYDNGDTHVNVDVNEVPDEQDASYFESDLQPYGEWVVTADFGRCFRPRAVGVDWRPYSEGHWVYTDDGWLWASDEPFGWATYHYGRWYEDDRNGWVWVPGRTWAPAWVAWRHGGGNCGWAPLPPRRHGDVSVDINIEIGRIRPTEYTFVDERYIDAPHVRTYARPVQQNVTIINNTTNITNITTVNNKVVNRGVPVAEVEQASGHKVKKVAVVQAADKGTAKVSGDTVAVFKKDLPPKKKKPVVANDTNTNVRNDRNNSRTLSTPDDSSKNKKPVVTDTNPPKKKPTDDRNLRTLSTDTDTTNNNNAAKKTDDARNRFESRDAVNDTGHNKTNDQPKPKKPVNTDTDKTDVTHTDKDTTHADKDTTHTDRDTTRTDKKPKTDEPAVDSSSKNKKKVDTDNDDNGKPNKNTHADDAPKSDPHKGDKPKGDDSSNVKTDDRTSHSAPKTDDPPKAKKPDTGKDTGGKGTGAKDTGKGKGNSNDSTDDPGKKKDKNSGDAVR